MDRYSRFTKIGEEMISLGAVEEQVRQIIGSELDLVAVNVPDGRKGEKVVVLVTGDLDPDVLRQQLINTGCNPLMIPASLYTLPEIPKLGSGKTDFHTAKQRAAELSAEPISLAKL